GQRVAVGDARLVRRAALVAVEVRQPAHLLDVRPVGGDGRLRRVAGEPGQGHHDDPRVERLQLVVTEAKALDDPRAEVLDEDVAHRRQLADDGPTGRLLYVDRH